MDLSNEYNYHLQDCVVLYYMNILLKPLAYGILVEVPNIQYYKPGGGFKIWHLKEPEQIV